MVGKRLRAKVWSLKCRTSCVQEVPKGREVKPRLVESQSPAVQWDTRRSTPEAATPNDVSAHPADRSSLGWATSHEEVEGDERET